MDKILNFLNKVPVWWIALVLWSAMSLRMCLVGGAGELTSEQGGIGYFLAFCFLMLSHLWRTCYYNLKDDVEDILKHKKE